MLRIDKRHSSGFLLAIVIMIEEDQKVKYLTVKWEIIEVDEK